MIACLNPCDMHIEENLSTLTYASRASYISNRPVKNEDPKLRQIEELKLRVAHLTSELYKANQTIDFLSKLTGQNPDLIKRNLGNVTHQEPSPVLTTTNMTGEPRKLQR